MHLSNRNRIFLLSLFFAFFCSSLTFSQTRGKIVGRVTDKETGEPLPGANIQLV